MTVLTVVGLLAALSGSSDAFLQPRPALARTQRRQSLAVATSTTLQAPPLSVDYDESIILDKNEESSLNAAEKFDWFKAWYPIVPVEILNPETPHKFQLLGIPIVVWKDSPMMGVTEFGPKPKKGKRDESQGTWRAFVDECPHRKVPLSEGRVEADGTLLCSYHGWRFDGQGDLVDIPQANQPEDLQRVKANPKSQCNSFPVQIVDGLLWIWPETGSDARIESALTEVKHYEVPSDKARDGVWYGSWNYRELPYGADYFIENVVDPAHVGVSHHNIVGSRYGNLKLGTMKRSTKLTKDGFQITTEGAMGQSSTTFHAPGHVAIETGVQNGALQTLELYASPSRPGFCNHVGRMVIVKDKDGKMPQLLRMFTLPLPTWANHVMASFFLNQDALFLHHQERYLKTTGDYTSLKNEPDFSVDHYNKAVLPVETDVGVVNFRNWLRILAGGRIPYKYNPTMSEANNDIVFDVWNSHTKHCHICQTALKNIKRARFASFVAAACLAVLRPATSKALNLAGVLATAGLGLALNKLAALFYRYEFSHAHND